MQQDPQQASITEKVTVRAELWQCVTGIFLAWHMNEKELPQEKKKANVSREQWEGGEQENQGWEGGDRGRREESEKDKKYHTEANYLSISAAAPK